jgi:hypothetical protein
MRIQTCIIIGGIALTILVRCELGEEERAGAGFACAKSFAAQGQEEEGRRRRRKLGRRKWRTRTFVFN